MKAQLLTMSTPDGPFTIIARDGAVLASGWTAVPGELTGQIHADLLPGEFETVTGLGAISEAVDGFYAGDPGPAMEVPVLQKSGPFRGHAWDMLRTVAPGHPVTYTEYAALSGNVKAVRAAASAGTSPGTSAAIQASMAAASASRNQSSIAGFAMSANACAVRRSSRAACSTARRR